MSDAGPVRAVLLAHGTMARGMVDAVRRISGVEEDALIPLSNDGRSPQVLQEELEGLLAEGITVVFTDLAGGSCALAARKCSSPVVVSGVNLPILLEFVFNRNLPVEKLVPRLLKHGGGAIKSIPEFPEHVDSPVSD
ncbi:MAG: PTS sugar transporter subunit IIA [Gemmatimonadota bacterium]